MNLTEKFLSFTLLGAEWVLWVLVGLSLVSISIMVDRFVYYITHNVDAEELAEQLRRLLRARRFDDALKLVRDGKTIEHAVVAAGLTEVPYGLDSMAEAMHSTKASKRGELEAYLAVLGTLGNNSPFIGLFGTVLGIIKASHDLTSGQQAAAANAVMAGVFEALVATAVGLMVAIPAVMAFNYFQRRVKATLSRVDMLAHLVMSLMHGDGKTVVVPPPAPVREAAAVKERPVAVGGAK